MSPLCSLVLPLINPVFQFPFNLFTGLGLAPIASIFSSIYQFLLSVLGCNI